MNKSQQLAELEGYSNPIDLMEAYVTDSVAPGICKIVTILLRLSLIKTVDIVKNVKLKQSFQFLSWRASYEY